jgi:cytochrome c oxidase subunit II
MFRICLALTLLVLGFAVRGSSSDNAAEIKVVASKFSFSPNEITVKKGQQVKIELLSSDANHGLVIEGLGIRTEAHKGDTAEVKFVPEETGTFEGKCAHFCGKGHGSMKLTVHVVE